MRSKLTVELRRTTPTTSYSWSSNNSARYEPSCPVTPVMSARILHLYRRRVPVSAKPLGIGQESLGRRVAKLRAELGWTQAQLAERIAVSRVALSHVESGLTVPSERTVTLLAGVFGCEPQDLVADSDYPVAKAERLPLVTARYTEVAHQLATLSALLGLVERVAPPAGDRLYREVRDVWRHRLVELLERTFDQHERHRLRAAIHGLSAVPGAARRGTRPAGRSDPSRSTPVRPAANPPWDGRPC